MSINILKIRKIYALNLVWCIFLFSGCTKLGPDFFKPDVPIADEWLGAADPSSGTAITTTNAKYAEWWKAFNDPVLDNLVQKAYQQNLPLQIAGIRILEARARLGIAVGNIYPQQVQSRGALSHVERSDNAPNSSPAADSSFRDINIGLDVGWELDLWGRFARGIEAADAELLSSIADYDDVLVSLTASVATAYVLIRTFEERLTIAKANVEIQKRSLEIADIRFQNGITTELDVQQARTLLLNTQAIIPALQIGQQQSKHALSSLLGLTPGNLEDLLEGNEVIPTAPAEVAVGIPAELLRRRPDIRRAELQAAAQSARIGIAETDLYPHFALLGSIGLRASDTFSSDLGDLFELDSIEAFGGPSFSWNIFNFGRIKNNVRVQDARFQQLIVNYQNTVLEASREVEDALVGFLRAREQVVFLEESVAAAERSVDLALLQYSDGVTDYQRVLDTQQSLITQQDLLTSSRGDIATSLISMYSALGGGWEIRTGKDFIPAETRQHMHERTDWGELLEPGAEEIPESEKEKHFRKSDW